MTNTPEAHYVPEDFITEQIGFIDHALDLAKKFLREGDEKQVRYALADLIHETMILKEHLDRKDS